MTPRGRVLRGDIKQIYGTVMHFQLASAVVTQRNQITGLRLPKEKRRIVIERTRCASFQSLAHQPFMVLIIAWKTNRPYGAPWTSIIQSKRKRTFKAERKSRKNKRISQLLFASRLSRSTPRRVVLKKTRSLINLSNAVEHVEPERRRDVKELVKSRR